MSVALHSPTILALCAGAGGLELGLKLALPGSRCVCYVEREAYAATTLVARMEDSSLDSAPIWDDLTTFDGRPWRGHVDLVTAGFPCQPWSTAGKGLGTADDRWLWPDIARIIGEVGPEYVFLENVSGLLAGGGAGEVLGSLADLGFDAEWCTLSARDLGAPHLRRRIFILAYASILGEGGLPEEPIGDHPPHPDGRGAAVAKPESVGERPGRGDRPSGEGRIRVEGGEARSHPHHAHEGVADTDGRGRRPRGDPGEPEQLDPADGTFPFWPPGPEDRREWEEILERWPEVEPAIRGVADGMASRMDRLRVLGNGVVPIVAAAAWRELNRRLKKG